MSDIPTDTTDPRAWHAYVAGAHTFTEAAERIDAAVRHGVDSRRCVAPTGRRDLTAPYPTIKTAIAALDGAKAT